MSGRDFVLHPPDGTLERPLMIKINKGTTPSRASLRGNRRTAKRDLAEAPPPTTVQGPGTLVLGQIDSFLTPS